MRPHRLSLCALTPWQHITSLQWGAGGDACWLLLPGKPACGSSCPCIPGLRGSSPACHPLLSDPRAGVSRGPIQSFHLTDAALQMRQEAFWAWAGWAPAPLTPDTYQCSPCSLHQELMSRTRARRKNRLKSKRTREGKGITRSLQQLCWLWPWKWLDESRTHSLPTLRPRLSQMLLSCCHCNWLMSPSYPFSKNSIS